MTEIVNVEAHRHWHYPLFRGRDPAHSLLLHGTSKRPWPIRGWLLQHIAPEAGGRLLFDLDRFKKPILVYNWK